MKFRAARTVSLATTFALLCVLLSGAQAHPPASSIFNEAALATLLEHIREFDHAMREGLDASTAELLLRLPRLWQELQTLEGRLQRSLPALREQIEALERELRRRGPRPAPSAGTFMV